MRSAMLAANQLPGGEPTQVWMMLVNLNADDDIFDKKTNKQLFS